MIKTYTSICVMLLATMLSASCGTNILSQNPSATREIGTDGQTFSLDELELIARDPDLSIDEKRNRFESLGIEDVDLIDALLNL